MDLSKLTDDDLIALKGGDLSRVSDGGLRHLRQQYQLASDRAEYSPTKGMGTLEKLAAGAGKGMTDSARGAGQWLGLVDRGDVSDARRLDAPLMQTGAGQVGNFIGKAVPLAATSVLAPGAGTVAGAGAIGAIAGALEPSESTGETLRNIAIGGATGAAGQKIGNSAADWLAKRAADKSAQFAATQTANAQKLGAARSAAGEGYVIPPSDIQPQGKLMEALGGLSGKIKTAQVASAKNQAVTDTLAKKAIGLSPDEQLTTQVLQGIRNQAGQAYEQIRGAGTVVADKTYNDALDGLLKQSTGAAKSFPGLKSDDLADIVKTMRQPQFDASDAVDAIGVLRDMTSKAYATGDKGLGKSIRGVSGALEDSIERHLAQTAPDAVGAFKEARQLIAKTYTVENALNSQTGAVSAAKLAEALKKGKPLSGELLTIARTGQAFPKSTQALTEAPKALSPLDWMVATGTGVATANPLSMATLAARPTARAALLSPRIQANAMKDLVTPSSRLADISNNELMRLLYGPVSSAAVVNSRQ